MDSYNYEAFYIEKNTDTRGIFYVSYLYKPDNMRVPISDHIRIVAEFNLEKTYHHSHVCLNIL